jgi:hypothetical protein
MKPVSPFRIPSSMPDVSQNAAAGPDIVPDRAGAGIPFFPEIS